MSDAQQPAVDLDARRGELVSGHGLVLRQWTEDDLPVMVELFDDPDIALRTPLPSPFTPERARERLGRAQLPDRLVWAITTDGGRALGEVLLSATGEIGYMVGARERGSGVATRALLLARDRGHGLGLPVLRLEIEPANVASATVARRAGFRRVHQEASVVEDKGRRYGLDVWEHARTT